MTELSLSILDIANNSTRAHAKNVEITLDADTVRGVLTVEITDDGDGMDGEFLKKVTDPFSTTRTTRKVGLGLPLFKMTAEQCGGEMRIESEKGKGTRVTATFLIDSIDRPPLGDLASTLCVLIGGAPETDFVLSYSLGSSSFVFDTKEVKQVLESDDICDVTILNYLKEMIDENLQTVNGGFIL